MLERFNSNKGECDIRAKLLMPIERLCVNQGNPWRWSNILVTSPGGKVSFLVKILHFKLFQRFHRAYFALYLYLFEPHYSLAPFRASLVRFLLRITTSAVATVSPVLCLPFPHFFCLPLTTIVRPRPFRNVIFNFIGGIFNICADYAEMDHRHQFSPVRSSSLQSADIIK